MSICDSPVAPVITTARSLRLGELYTLDRSPIVCPEASTQSAISESISFTLDPRNYQVRADGTNVRAPIPVAPGSSSTSAPAKPLPMVAAQYEFVNVRAATIGSRPRVTPLYRLRPIASRASASISRFRSLSRLSCSFFPFATASSHLIRPFFR